MTKAKHELFIVLQGCFLAVKSYFQFFNMLFHKADQTHIMHLLIEALGTFSYFSIIYGSLCLLLHVLTSYLFTYRHIFSWNCNADIWSRIV